MVDWDADGAFDGVGDVGEDLTSRTFRIEWKRGRDFASQLTGRASGGRLFATINNESGDYSSFKTTSPIAGNILPGRKVRLTATDATGMVTLWQGFLNSLVPIPSMTQPSVVMLEAIGPLAWLNQRLVSLPRQVNILTGNIIDAILDEAGWPALDRDTDAGRTTVKRFPATGSKRPTDRVRALDLMRQIEETEGGFLHESRDGKVIFEARDRRLSGAFVTSQATFSDATGATLPYVAIEQLDPLPLIYNIFHCPVQLFTVGTLAVLWTLSESGASSPSIPAGESRTYVTDFLLTESSTFGVDAWTTPVATTDFTANSAADGSGTNLTASIAVTAVKDFNHMEITLTNNHASTTAFITLLQARGTPVNRSNLVTITIQDAASIIKYGERTFNVAGLWVPDTVEAKDYVTYLNSIFSSPLPIVKITLEGNQNAAMLSEVLRRNISDRVTITAATNADLGLSARPGFIELEHHVITRDRRHVATYAIAPIGGFDKFWVLDTSRLDESTALFY